MPTNIQPLKHGNPSSTQIPHQTSLCQKCIELGYNCRDYSPPPIAFIEDIPDDQSIISDTSTASTFSSLNDQQDCHHYVPPPNVLVQDIPDDQASIISEVSSASTTSSFLDDQQLSDGDITPVGSDNEDFIVKKMKQMNLH